MKYRTGAIFILASFSFVSSLYINVFRFKNVIKTKQATSICHVHRNEILRRFKKGCGNIRNWCNPHSPTLEIF